MYRPVLEEDLVDRHEFVEIHNPEARDAPLDGWSLGGSIGYDFPAGSALPAGGYIVVAASRDALLGMTQYQLDSGHVYGDWAGALGNGGGNVLLLAPDQTIADAVAYDDEAPWPEAADALGASDDWLRPDLLPLEPHRHLGHSLERVSFEVGAAEVANWDVSPLDQPSPGRANAGAREQPRVIVLSATVASRDGAGLLIHADDEVLLRVRMSKLGEVGAAELDYHVDDLATTGETVTTVSLRDDGAEGDETAGDRMFSVVLPPLPENTIVRYRVRIADGAGAENGGGLEFRQVSPRPSSPYGWHAYFVSPVIEAETDTYQIFISSESWTKMWTNIEAGRVPQECMLNPTWDTKVPAVFVHEGKVYDVLARHQGSRYQRTNGADIQSWPGVGPSAPTPLRALSWHLNFPRYARFQGRRVLTLNKLIQTCPGMTAGVGMQLFADAGVPASQTRYVRLLINGYYYRYMLDIEHYTEDFLEDYHESQPERPDGIEYQVGHLFKASGYHDNEGPWGPADGRQLGESCGYSPAQRYAYTYERKTHEWMNHDNLIALIDGMHAARAQGTDALRAYLGEHFDVDIMLSYLAVMNWSVPFDDMFHNYYLYQRIEDEKWILMPWDLDRNFGEWRGARDLGPTSSIYVGEEGDPDNRDGTANHFKDVFLEAYRSEFEQRLRELNQTVLHPDHVSQVVDKVASGARPAEAAESLSGVACSFTEAPEQFKQFARGRHEHVNSVLGPPQ
jgi:spore coat protein CotH